MNSKWLTGHQTAFFRTITLALGVSVALVSGGVSAQRVLLDKIIAIVDEDVVLQSEFDARMRDVQANAARSNMQLPEEEQLRQEIMDALILENIQMQLAERVSIRFDDDTINRVLNNMAANNNMTLEEYQEALDASGVYLQTREEVRKQMTMQELQRGMVNRRITITEQEIDNFLNSEMGKEVMAPEYFVDHMLVPTPATDSPEDKAAKLRFAADLVARMREGETLPQVRAAAAQARVFPIDGTEFGWRKADQLPNLFADIVTNMGVGEVEGPIEAGNGYHIIQLTNQEGGLDQIVKQTNIRHIMLTPNEIRNEEQTQAAIEELRQRIVDGEDFASIARQNSDDANSVVGGGDLDWIGEGGMPPEMERVVAELEIDELSQPFRSQAGWHIVEVLGRRDTDLSAEYSRAQAENALRNRKFDLELQNWLIEIREEAFVELVE